jgi:PAS domain S-box-containing protein
VKQELHNAILSALGLHVAIVDGDGVIVDVNEGWTRFAAENGGSTDTGVGENYFDVCRRAAPSCPDARVALDGMLSVSRGETSWFHYGYRCDSPTEPRWFAMTVVPLPLTTQGLIVAHQNNTETQQAAARFGELLDSVRAVIWRADAQTFRTTFASKQTVDILGFPAEAWSREPDLWLRHIHPDDRDWVTAFSATAVRECRNHAFEYRMIAADGRVVWLRNIVNVIAANGVARELVGVSVDITERKRAEEDRDAFARALLDAHEKERAFIARELHDDLGQSVALLALNLSGLGQQIADAPARRNELGELISLIDKIAVDLRRVSHGLHPSSLEILGLGPAIRQLCADLAQRQSIALDCDVAGIPRDLDKAVAISLYRVVQECLRNILKHSQAASARIRVSGGDGEIRLQISDDGVGFDREAARRSGGLGLASMEERLRLVRGKFAVTSAAGQGTRIDATVPLH